MLMLLVCLFWKNYNFLSFLHLQLLPDNIGDPMELLSYLGPPDGSGSANNSGSNSDDLLSLFDS